MNFKPLWVYWHAVDIEQVTEGLKTIPCDQYHISYYDYPFPHREARRYFLEHPEYTHIILHPNDLICDVSHFEGLKKMVLENDFDVCCGVCNVDTNKYKDYWNVTKNLPSLDYENRRYYWLSKNRYPNTIIQVPFAGFPAMCVKRHVIEKTPVNSFLNPQKTTDAPIWEVKGGFSNDLIFCHNLKDLDIKINCNTAIQMLHLRYHGINQVGKKEPKTTFYNYNDYH